MTGTVLQGRIKVGDNLEIPSLGVARKVKSIQMFRKGVDSVSHGDRAGVCVTQFDPSLLERGLACAPGTVPITFAVIIDLNGIPYYKGEIRSKAKFHISLGHETVMARVSIFSEPVAAAAAAGGSGSFSFDNEYRHAEIFATGENNVKSFALLEFEKAVPVVPNCIVIGSKLDTDINANICRLAFHGTVRWATTDKDYAKTELQNLKVFKNKCKEGVVERASNEFEVIVRDLVKKETNLDLFTGLRVELSSGESGSIEGTFGQSGKIKVRVVQGLSPETYAKVGGKKKKGEGPVHQEPVTVKLHFKRYIFDQKKRMIQS